MYGLFNVGIGFWGGRTLKPKKDHQKKPPNKTPLIKVLGFGSSFLCGSRPVKLISFSTFVLID